MLAIIILLRRFSKIILFIIGSIITLFYAYFKGNKTAKDNSINKQNEDYLKDVNNSKIITSHITNLSRDEHIELLKSIEEDSNK